MTSEDDVRSLLAALPSPDMPESVAQAITARSGRWAGTPSGSTADVALTRGTGAGSTFCWSPRRWPLSPC